MLLIVGLGNPDKKYEKTYHNVGFMAIDGASKSFGVNISKTDCKSLVGDIFVGGEKVIFAKPQTYMNLSGEAVRELMHKYKIPLENLLVVYDDFEIERGLVRIRKSGSAGTHNGMRNIVSEISSGDFARIRVGIKQKDENVPKIDFVLSKISAEEMPLIKLGLEKAEKAIIDFIKGESLENIMQNYNGK